MALLIKGLLIIRWRLFRLLRREKYECRWDWTRIYRSRIICTERQVTRRLILNFILFYLLIVLLFALLYFFKLLWKLIMIIFFFVGAHVLVRSTVSYLDTNRHIRRMCSIYLSGKWNTFFEYGYVMIYWNLIMCSYVFYCT